MPKLTEEERRERERERYRRYRLANLEYLALKKRLAYHQDIEKGRQKARERYRKRIEKDPDFNKRHWERYREYYRVKFEQNPPQRRQKDRVRNARKTGPVPGTDMKIYRKHEAEILSAIALEAVSNV